MLAPDRVLLVDDEVPILMALKRTFEAAGYEVIAHSDPRQALESLRSMGPQVIGADYMMPEMNGAEFLQAARSIAPDTVRLLITAATDFGTAVDAINRGEIYRFITKPWNREDLLATVRQAFELYHLRRRAAELAEVVQAQNAELRRMNQSLEALVQERTSALLDGMIAALDFRDTETQWHSRRVSRFTRRLAEALGISGQALLTIEQGALLHDIGKIGVRDAILLKPGPLTPDEWDEMRLHPELGARLLSRIDFLAAAAEIVLQHQEKWDGSGYPRGLAGEAIHIGARCFHVADAFDAITSDRPYRKSQSYEVAREEIARHAGKQFDPRVVQAFLSVPPEDWTRIREEIDELARHEVPLVPESMQYGKKAR